MYIGYEQRLPKSITAHVLLHSSLKISEGTTFTCSFSACYCLHIFSIGFLVCIQRSKSQTSERESSHMPKVSLFSINQSLKPLKEPVSICTFEEYASHYASTIFVQKVVKIIACA